MDLQTIKEMDQAYVAHTYARQDLAVKEGKGATCTDWADKSYIDFTSGIGVNCFGFCDEQWTKAVTEQLGKYAHISNLFYASPCQQAAKLLCEKTGMKKVFFANTGAEANEGAFKVARKYSSDKYSHDRCEIITLVNSFHGRTIAALEATGQDVFHKNFGPFTGAFVYAKANDLADLQSKITDKTCAVMMEMIQGEGGVMPLERDFVQGAAKLCAEKDLLFIADEVQAGMGRTGRLMSYEHFGVHPDVVTLAKGLGGGLPIGAVLMGEKCENTLGASDHGSTFGGNPVSCAGAVSILERMNSDLFAQAARSGEYIRSRLAGCENVESVAGMGLMLGIQLKKGDAKEAVKICLEKGLIILTAKTKIRLLPPLNISHEELEKGMDILCQVIDSL